MTPKKTPTIIDQLTGGSAALDAWGRGDARLRTTIVSKDGRRHTQDMNRAELDARRARVEAFKEIRTKLEFSQPQFAGLLHASPAAVRQWEQGRREIPDYILALADLTQDPKNRARLKTFVTPTAESLLASVASPVVTKSADSVARDARPRHKARVSPVRAPPLIKAGTKKGVAAG